MVKTDVTRPARSMLKPKIELYIPYEDTERFFIKYSEIRKVPILDTALDETPKKALMLNFLIIFKNMYIHSLLF